MKLVLCEKPSVGRDITQYLNSQGENLVQDKSKAFFEGNNYIVTWAVGHLLGLENPENYNKKWKTWKLETLPMIPDQFLLKPLNQNLKQLNQVKKLINKKEVKTIINACDAGREGELIFAYIYQYANSKKPVERLWLSSMTKKAIEDAFKKLLPPQTNLEQAARGRSEADWLVGINATRASSVRLRKSVDGVVSLGRVQTPTLALLVQKEIEIKNFKPEDYWTLDAEFKAKKGEYLGQVEQRFKSEKEVVQLKKQLENEEGQIIKIEKKEETLQPPLLYDLTSLQREANSKLGFSAKRTLSICQGLYEKQKALTYPRTSSRYLSTDMEPSLPFLVKTLTSFSEYKDAAFLNKSKLKSSRIIDDSKVSDHHAIIPTDNYDRSKFSEDEEKIFDLVARRFLATFCDASVVERTKVETKVHDTIFTTRGRRIIKAGWQKIANTLKADELVPELEENEEVLCQKINWHKKETQPPRRLSDAGLLSLMETAGKLVDDDSLREALKEGGLGTPATRAQIIERLIQVDYAERVDKSLRATEKGVQVIQLLGNSTLTKADLTGEWEKKLLQVERGELQKNKFMEGVNKYTTQTVEELKKLDAPERDIKPVCPCPTCGKPVYENRRGYSCWRPKDPGCGTVVWKKMAGKVLPRSVCMELLKNKKTENQVEGFKNKKGRQFKAKLKLAKVGKAISPVFDEEWSELDQSDNKSNTEKAEAAEVK